MTKKILQTWVIISDAGTRRWQAEDEMHAREQQRDAFPDETIMGAVQERTLTYTQAMLLGDLIRACQAHAKLMFYPRGVDSANNPTVLELRMFTEIDSAVAWPSEKDIRDAYVWCSGVFEQWFAVGMLLQALDNLSGEHGETNPIAIIEYGE